MTTSQYLLVAGSTIVLVLGSIHLLYTFFTNKFDPRHPATKELMQQDALVLTRETNLWRAWVGFNASHSAGAMFIGASNLILATQYVELYSHSIGLPLLTVATLVFYIVLAKKYWFRIPYAGLLIATACFVAGFALAHG